MPFGPGARLGPYIVDSLIGAGGMGEVYRARDVRLNRDVAVKVLPQLFAGEPERLARFTREAQTLAALNHPNIAHVYGVEDSGEVHALVMEFVEGEDLSQRLARGPIPLDETLPIARQIADALEAAHEHGIVHRDLKPANIKVRPDGTVKVLDFGLAKAMEAVGSGSSASAIANSPTFSAHATQIGLILGTAAYMAPEQARGKPIDRRADIWAFGAVLFEMLTGRHAFDGDEVSDVLASVLKSDPAWAAIPSDVPVSLRRLLRRCLEKDPHKRLSSIADARLELDEPDPPAGASSPVASQSRWKSHLGWLAAGALGAVVVGLAAIRLLPRQAAIVSGAVTRLSIVPPAGRSLYPDSSGIVISPDGSKVAFVIGTYRNSASELWVRPLDSLEARRLGETDGARLPFWSPDSTRIGFFTTDRLMTIAASGEGHAQEVCPAAGGRGAVWMPSNVIVFAPAVDGPLYKVSASGGVPTQATTLDTSRNESGHRHPTALPDGDHILYAALPGHDGFYDVFAGSLTSSSRTLIGSMESVPVYAPPGWLLYSRQGRLTARRFDAEALRLTGDPIAVGDEPSMLLDSRYNSSAAHTVSVAVENGSLAYYTAPSAYTSLVRVDAAGRPDVLDVPHGHYDSVTIAPDGTQAVLVRSSSPSQSSLWLKDLVRGGIVSLKVDRGRNDAPVWSPDNRHIVFSSDRNGPQDLFVKDVTDPAAPERVLYSSPELFKNADSWSIDGKWIILDVIDPKTDRDLWLLRADGSDSTPTPLVRNPGLDADGMMSPDGHWMIYSNNETGRSQLYATAFPKPGRQIQISSDGAFRGWWSADSRQVIYVDDRLASVWRADVEPGTTLRFSPPVKVATLPPNVSYIAPMPDRRAFLALIPERSGQGLITIVQNWRAALETKR